MKGNGTSTDIVNYDFIDSDISLSTTYYYRLKQLDYDDGHEYSSIIAIDIERNSVIDMRLYPNPATDFITVAFDLEDGALYHARLIDLSGRVVAGWQNRTVLKGNNYTTLDIENVQMGQYILSVTIGTKTINQKILITK